MFLIISTLGNAVYPWHFYARIVMSIGNEGHKSSSASTVTIITLEVVECRLIFLGGGGPDELGSLVIRG